MPPKKKTPDFEQSLAALEEIVTKMEEGNLTLEESLRAFEQGITLTRDCHTVLAQTEQKVEMLMEAEGELSKVPFTPDEEN